MEALIGILLFVGFGLIVWGAIAFVVGIMRLIFSPVAASTQAAVPQNNSDMIDGMNNGDYYNGPHGYSPMTGYPETQYGSGFDPDAQWNHEERD
jgi:hypothetical protein